MRIALLSDIHGNREALDSALEYLADQNIDTVWSPGDFVDYGADPDYVVKWAMENVESAVLGNHDAVIVNKETPDYFNRYARAAIPYTKKALSSVQLQWLEELPYATVREGIRLVHASPDNPSEWTYVVSQAHAQQLFDSFTEQICIIGHTHVQCVFDSTGNTRTDGIIELQESVRYLVNPGSIGQPRDKDPRWALGILDTGEQVIELVRGDYNVERAASRISEAGLPEFLGDRLFRGR